ncbi:MAG TPA: PaaX family transcriptional regulator C-terminal domain-containing protein [Pseudonocardia sp.]
MGSARSLLLTILSELVLPDNNATWTSSLLYVLTGLGLEEQTARQAIARASDAGLIASERHGRTVRWTVTEAGRTQIESITRRAASLITPPERWDGNCLIVVVTVPQRLRAVRKRLYSSLYWQGFGNPAPGLWASPHVDRVEELRTLIDDLGLRDSTVTFIGNTLGVGLTEAEIVARAWDLDNIAGRYEKLIETYTGIEPEPGDDLLFTHLSLINEYREFPAMDPQLPENLLPDWVGHRATDLFINRNNEWAPAAHQRWRQIVEMTSPSS